MRWHVVFRNVGAVLLLNAAFLLIAAAVALGGSREDLFPLFYSGLLAALFGVFPLIFVPHPEDISNAEGLVTVPVAWILSCLVGSLPYLLWGGEFTPTNAWFESVSGYTTTGSSILTDVEAVPPALLFWRAATHWIGGVGIIVFVLAILPGQGFSAWILYRMETSAGLRERVRYRARKAVQVIVTVYVGLTVLQAALLYLLGLNLLDAVAHAFATIATGGFSTRNASVAAFDSVAVEAVCIFFMVVSGLHFAVLFGVLVGRGKELWRSSAHRFYLASLAVGIAVAAVCLHGAGADGWPQALRVAAFQVVSVGTSTGFATADSSVWPALAQMALLFLTLQCACMGSTSGGIKADRIALFGRAVARALFQLRHPRAVVRVRMDGRAVQDDVVEAGVLYVVLYLAVVFAASLVLVGLGMDPLSSFSGCAATMGNVGPGLGTLGSLENFAHVPEAGKWVLSLTMLLGRLEIYGLLAMLAPRRWT
jgi:trk system potassium uptake protein TrkH